MIKKITYLIFLSGQFDSKLPTVQDLVTSISKYKQVICFEYPQFSNLIDIITLRKKLIYHVSNNLIVYHSVGVFPYGRSISIINFINHYLNYLILSFFIKLNFTNLKIITITPEVYYLSRFEEIRHSDITYFVEEDYTSLPFWGNRSQKKQFKELEKKFLPHCKRVITNSQPIFNKYTRLHKKVLLFLQPSNISEYLKDKSDIDIEPFDLRSIPRPIAGFIGSFYDWKIDMDLYYKLLNKYPKISFVVIGLTNISTELRKKLENKKNFYYLGYRSRRKLPLYLKQFNICLIPYSVQKAYYAFPTKIFEYLVFGKPVVTTALQSIKFLKQKQLIYWSENNQQFIYNVKKALNEKKDNKLITQRRIESLKNCWGNKIFEFMHLTEL